MPDDIREPSTAVAIRHESSDMLTNRDAFEHGWRVAKLFADSQLIPPHLRGKPADCFIALHMARELRENPVVVMQNIYIVSGKAGWSATYMIGRANRSGVFKGRITWASKGQGDALEVTARATLADTGEMVDAMASMAMAKAEGWTKNSKYQTMGEHMLRWRSATMLIRLYAPEVMLGIPTSDEIEDMGAASRAVDVTATARTVDVDAFEAAADGAPILTHESPAAGDGAADAATQADAPAERDIPDAGSGGRPPEVWEFLSRPNYGIPVLMGERGMPNWAAWHGTWSKLLPHVTSAELAKLRADNAAAWKNFIGYSNGKPAARLSAEIAQAEARLAQERTR